jgi:2-C-methyl-D-erythritol 4-phosphate cytidylyltransferase
MAVNAPAVVPALPVYPTVATREGVYLNRGDLLAIQLPQIFDTATLIAAHNKADRFDYTDDSSLVADTTGILPVFIKGLPQNLKITTPWDLLVSEVIYHEHRNYNRG